jgi:uncharacterized protein (DUF2147 family)
MKKLIMILAIFALSYGKLFSQANNVIGIWLTDGGKSQVEIYRAPNGKYEGKLVWLRDPLDENRRPKLDKENPDSKLKSQPLLGLVLLKDFEYDASAKEWKGGTIYDPDNGKTYSAYMWFNDSNTLNIKGFVLGMRFLGRSTTWTREREKKN